MEKANKLLVLEEANSVIGNIKLLLNPYQALIETKINESVNELGLKTTLRDACQYALLSGGKRFRPAIALMVAKALNRQHNVLEAALAVEYFHCASLVADDLPCMDNDDLRRNKPSLHKVYGEATALLVTYALIAAGYQKLVDNAEILRMSGSEIAKDADAICVKALACASYNTGIFGATGGQFFDLFPPKLNVETIQDILDRKTVTLFEISFVLGWLYGGGDLSKLERVKVLAYHFGMAFQIADDLGDYSKDQEKERKANLAIYLGKEDAYKRVQKETELYLALLEELGLANEDLSSLANLNVARAEKGLLSA